MRNTKTNGWKVASNIIFYGGVMVCMAAVIAYLLMHQFAPEKAILGPFDVNHLIYIGIAAAACVVIAIILRIIGNVVAKKAAINAQINEAVEEVVEEVVEEEEPIEEVVEEVVVEEAPVEETVVDPCCEKCAAIRNKLTMTPETKEKVVATAKKSIPVLVAIVATAVVSTKIAQSKNEKKKARARKTLLDFFY